MVRLEGGSGFVKLTGAVLLFVGLASLFQVEPAAAGRAQPADKTAAVQQVNDSCASLPVAFSAYPSDITFNTGSGEASYKINIVYKRCSGSETRAYAVIGQPVVCPLIGWYGAAGNTYDCLKFIGDPRYSGASSLSCFSGSRFNENCVNGDFWSRNIGKTANQPGTDIQEITVSMTSEVPGWRTSGGAAGRYVIGGADILCQFYKYGAGFGATTVNACQDLIIEINVGKRPKVQILGGDLIVGRASATNAKRNSTVSTSVTAMPDGRMYGSWVEYALVPTGTVRGMASRSGYVGGSGSSDLCSLSVLTFTNANGEHCQAASIGSYDDNSVASNIAASYPVQTGTTRLSGTIDIGAEGRSGVFTATDATLRLESSVPIARGQSFVLNAPDTTVVVSGNIAYVSGPFTTSADIPQVVIIAKNIIISDAVGRLDAWLVATGSGADGRVNTCGAGSVGETSNLTSVVCTAQLTINGPVMANHLQLRRTFGSDNVANAGVPAEIVNLRGDAYLWANAHIRPNSVIPTASTKELPPRY